MEKLLKELSQYVDKPIIYKLEIITYVKNDLTIILALNDILLNAPVTHEKEIDKIVLKIIKKHFK